MWIVRLALRRPYTVATLCLAILLMGILSVVGMDVDIFPSINIPVVVVVWNYPGMSADDMERRVTLVSERGISTSVSGVTKIESQSINSTSVVKVYFDPDAEIGGAEVSGRENDSRAAAKAHPSAKARRQTDQIRSNRRPGVFAQKKEFSRKNQPPIAVMIRPGWY